MMKTAPLSLVLALSLFGCSTDRSVAEGDDGGGSGSDQQPPPPQPKLDAAGTYRVNSTFDLASTMPGASGTFVNGLIAATDDPDDPMSWLLDQMIAQMQPGTLKTVLQGAKPLVAGYLNNQLTQLAPGLVGTIVDLGHRMADLTKKFGVNERLAVVGVDQVYLARITADGVRFDIEGTVTDATFADYNLDNVVVDAVPVKLENENRLEIGVHTLPLEYGKIVRIGLDTAIIPGLDPSAHSLTELLDNLVDCHAVGLSVASSLGVGSAALWQSVCLGGLQYAADQVYGQIVAADSMLDVERSGTARAIDANNDYKVDKLTFGVWSGSMMYDTTAAAIAQPATFVGVRM